MLCKQRQQQQAKFTDRITGDAKWADVLNFSLQSTSSDVFKIYNGAVTVHQITLREITAISTENVHIPTLRCRFACEEESRAARRAIVTPPPPPQTSRRASPRHSRAITGAREHDSGDYTRPRHISVSPLTVDETVLTLPSIIASVTLPK